MSVHRDHHIRCGAYCLDQWQYSIKLLSGTDGGTATERHAAHVHDVRAIGSRNQCGIDRTAEFKRGSIVEEGIRRALDDRHHRNFSREIERSCPDQPPHVSDTPLRIASGATFRTDREMLS
jgi:hypothetical protein